MKIRLIAIPIVGRWSCSLWWRNVPENPEHRSANLKIRFNGAYAANDLPHTSLTTRRILAVLPKAAPTSLPTRRIGHDSFRVGGE